MLFSHRIPIVTFAMLAWLGIAACSSSKRNGESTSGNPDAAAEGASSKADQVGSVPEDMLADEKGVDSSGMAAVPQATPADPFGDLKQKEPEPKAASTEVSDVNALMEGDSGNGGSGGSGGGSPSGSGKLDNYTVKAGDTLMKVAFQIYGDVDRWKDLHEWNKEKLKGSGSALRKGMILSYDPPSEAFSPAQLPHTYEIKKGDTLAGIADDVYGRKAKYKKLQSYNKRLIKNPNRIFAGFSIFYDITEKELAEAEAHRAQKAAGGGSAPAPAEKEAAAVPSAISPPDPAPAQKVATTPTASDSSAVPGPGAQQGPPAPPAAQ